MANEQLQEIIDTFNSVDPDLRLELLLDYSRKLPALPDKYREAVEQGVNRVPECMTPVFLFIEADDGVVRLHFEVAEESPTVRGLLGIISESCDGKSLDAITDIPDDIVQELGLADLIRMQRAVGLSGVLGRIKRQAAAATEN